MIANFTWDGYTFDFDEEVSINGLHAAAECKFVQEQDSVTVKYSDIGADESQVRANVLHAVSVLDSELLAEMEVFENVAGEVLLDDVSCTVDIDGLTVYVELEEESRDIINGFVDDALEHLVDCVKFRISQTGVDGDANMELHEMSPDELVLALMENNEQRRAYVRDVYATVGCVGVTSV